MIYSIQSHLEDYFERCGLPDPDQYAVDLAKLYDRQRLGMTAPTFLSAMRRIRTSFYRRNKHVQRPIFEQKILRLLDSKFKKKEFSSSQKQSPKGLKLRATA